ncbi:hypothetical protein [Fibrobacter succinogenes]|uniref:hypothetical protein n=1 Tax=Fibrobacter succinogenes TaxID=833 RepID=UPI0015641D89|nr:hypothetical protein [Fibrobacter succinogenes]
MKRLILFIAIFGALLANAQEMDTTIFVNAQGQTIGIVHEKGTLPVISQQQQTNELQSQNQTMQQQMLAASEQQANLAFDYDSTSFYEDLIQQNTESGNKIRRVGKGMMLGGGIGAGLGLAFIYLGATAIDCETDKYGNETCQPNSGEILIPAGVIAMIGGAMVFGAGTIVKLVGGIKIRKARHYEIKFQKYQRKQQYSVKLRLDPLIDPINKMAGVNLAMEF